MPDWLHTQTQEVVKVIALRLPTVGAALAVLVFGWMISLIVRGVVYAMLRRTTLDNKLAELLGMEKGGAYGDRIERMVSRAVYYICLAIVFVVFFNVLGVEAITHPLVTMLNGFAGAVPNLAKAALLGLLGFLAAMVVRSLIVMALQKLKFDDRIAKFAPEIDVEAAPKGKKGKKDKEAAPKESISRTIGNVAYWFVLLIAAVPVVEALEIGVLARPLSAGLEMVTTYLPRVGAAGLLLVLGYVVAKLLRSLTTGVLEKTGLDGALSRIGLGRALGEHSLSKLIGTLVFALVLVQFTISALGRLQIEEISRPATQALEQVYGYMPKLFVGGLLLSVGVVIARVVGNVAASLTAALGFNTLIGHIGLSSAMSDEAKAQEAEAQKAVEGTVKALEEEKESSNEIDSLLAGRKRLKTPADIVGLVVSAIVVLLFLRQTLSTMQLDGLSMMLDRFIAYLPHALAASAVLIAGLWAGRWAGERIDELTSKSTDRLMKALGKVARGLIVVFSAMVALEQLGVGRELVAMAFTLVLGAICLALALAFGLGGREVASKILSKEYEERQKKR